MARLKLTAAALKRLQGGKPAPKATRPPPALAAPSSAVRLEVVVPLRLQSVLNGQVGHWAVRRRRVKAEREAVRAALWGSFGPDGGRLFAGRPVRVTVTRLGGRPLDEAVNLPASAKAVEDEAADWVGMKDNDPRWSCRVAQEPGGPYGVRVTIEAGTATGGRT